MCKQSHMTLLITFILDLMVIQVDTEGVLPKIMEGQKTVPITECFGLFGIRSILIQIT